MVDLSSFGLSNFAMGDALIKAYWIALILLIVAVVGFSTFFIVRFFQYKTNVMIIEKRADGWKIRFNKARKIFGEGGHIKFKLRGSSVSFQPPPDFTCIFHYKGKDLMIVRKEADGFYFYNKISENGELVTIPQEVTQWYYAELQRNEKKYAAIKSWFEKYGQVVSLGIIAGLFIITVILLLRSVDNAIAAGAGVKEALLGMKIQTIPAVGG